MRTWLCVGRGIGIFNISGVNYLFGFFITIALISCYFYLLSMFILNI